MRINGCWIFKRLKVVFVLLLQKFCMLSRTSLLISGCKLGLNVCRGQSSLLANHTVVVVHT